MHHLEIGDDTHALINAFYGMLSTQRGFNDSANIADALFYVGDAIEKLAEGYIQSKQIEFDKR